MFAFEQMLPPDTTVVTCKRSLERKNLLGNGIYRGWGGISSAQAHLGLEKLVCGKRGCARATGRVYLWLLIGVIDGGMIVPSLPFSGKEHATSGSTEMKYVHGALADREGAYATF